MSQIVSNHVSPWPHRTAIGLFCATFPLLWVGGLVTTTDSGMAVPDWPNTYGYNLFLYPLSTWLTGPWDIFVEHGHRLLASAVGLFTIVLMVVLWKGDERKWMRWLGVGALGLVIFQGVLGGMRVVLNEQTLAMLHGCIGPLFFALTLALVVFTSQTWRSDTPPSAFAHGATIRRLAVVTCILVYVQLLLGAVLRHVPISTEPGTFALAVKFHLFMAAVLFLHIAMLVWCVIRHAWRVRVLRHLAIALAGLLVLQISLGGTTWVVKYGVPPSLGAWVPTMLTAVVDKGWLQTHVVTGHMAVGSLMLVTSLALALYSLRLLAAPARRQVPDSGRLEVAI